jgi:hypothetical protein
LREINFVGRGKIGHGVDAMLHELGIKLSRAIQGRNPDTGTADTPPIQLAPKTQYTHILSLSPRESRPDAKQDLHGSETDKPISQTGLAIQNSPDEQGN